jgi:hypothetical protein
VNQEFDNELPKPKHHTKPFNSVAHWLLGCAIILLLSILITPLCTGTLGRGHDKARAINNSKQIGLALFEFNSDYEAYPSNDSVGSVTESFPDHGYELSGESSNTLFLQLFAAGIVRSEEIFYAKIKNTQNPDGDITPGKALQKGEVGFSYIYGLTSKDDPLTPLLLTPLIPGTTKFDTEAFKGTAIIYHINNEISTYEIHKNGHVYDEDGLDILSPKHPIWKGKAPDIRYPE